MRMSTFKFNTKDTEGQQAKFPYPKELREEDQFLAEVVAALAPCVRAMQAKDGRLSEEKRATLLSEVKKVFEIEKS